MRLQKKHDYKIAEGDMTPMIDMTFQLIAFFMVLLNFSEVEQDQSIRLPLSELAKPPDEAYKEPLTVQVTKDDKILFGGSTMGIAQLQTSMLREAQLIRAYEDKDKKIGDATIVIRADRDVKTGFVQEIMDICQQAGFEEFAFRSRQSDQSTLGGPQK